MKLHLDFETRSEVDVNVVGTWAYALHPSTEVTAMTFGADKDHLTTLRRVEVTRLAWQRVDVSALAAAPVITAHYAHFEYAVWNLILHRRLGWPQRWAPSLWRCTMAKAAACGLPLGLNPLAVALQLKTLKDIEGKTAMLKLTRPLRVDPVFGAVYDETPATYERMYVYNRSDVVTEIEADESLPDLLPQEQRIWELDLEMNRRGLQVDVDFCRRARDIAAPLIERLNVRLHALTCRTPQPCTVKTCTGVDKATRVQALKGYLSQRHGIDVSSLDKEGVTRLLEDPELSETVREVLTIRRQVGKKNSIAKYNVALEQACPDGRARGQFQYHAAHPGRWGGRGIQPQNMVKGPKQKDQAEIIAAVMAHDADGFVAKYGSRSLEALSDAGRGMFVAAPGKVLVCADFNAVEARVLFWLAGELDALAAYRRGESPYLSMAQTIYPDAGLPDVLTPAMKATHEYDIGKRTVLGCGYMMGAPRFKSNVYTETAKMGKPVTISKELAERAVTAYRTKYARVKNLWYEAERAAINAVKSPGRIFFVAGGKIGYSMSVDRRFLLCRLPSGRFIRYWKPSVQPGETPWGEEREMLHFLGEDEQTRQWVPMKTYGGALVENFTQAVARDLMANGLLNVDAAGYPPVLTVHDEGGSEASVATRSAEDLLKDYISHLCRTPAWAAGCPVAAEGWVRTRYGK